MTTRTLEAVQAEIRRLEASIQALRREELQLLLGAESSDAQLSGTVHRQTTIAPQVAGLPTSSDRIDFQQAVVRVLRPPYRTRKVSVHGREVVIMEGTDRG